MTSRPRRSALYMPASNAKAIEKARSLPCDVVILDLEDAVAPEAKEEARAAAVAAVQSGGFGGREVAIRANGLDTEWGAADLAAIAQSGADAVLVPKVSSPQDILACEAALAPARILNNLRNQVVSIGFDGITHPFSPRAVKSHHRHCTWA